MPIARRHHVVPRFYLSRFADDRAQLRRVPLGDSTSHLIAVGDATVQTDYFAVESDVGPADAFEGQLSGIEGKAAGALARMLDERVWPMSLDDRYLVAMWIGLQHLRSQSTRTEGEEIGRTFLKLEVGVSTTKQVRERLQLPPETPDEEVERLRARMLASANTFDLGNHQRLQIIAETLPGMTNLVFFRRPWMLITWERKTLATSDTPVILGPSVTAAEDGTGTSLGVAREVIVPVSRRAALLLGDLPTEGPSWETHHVPGNAFIANAFNQYTLWNARREAFHHPDDDPFANVKIPNPRDREMVDNTEHIDSLIRAFARQQGRPSGLPDDAAERGAPFAEM
ncbi:MAG: DUF4238 domain-containing protein [Actinomycetota bacterium]|nr:DUF4238 domain-containing protein [Actinomycetota bacterium]